MSDWSDEETDNPLYADEHNFHKIERWSKDDQRIEAMLYAGKQSRQGAGHFCQGCEAPAADQVDHPAADTGARSVAAGMTARLDL